MVMAAVVRGRKEKLEKLLADSGWRATAASGSTTGCGG